MPFCPNCKYEYRAGCTECPDCDATLVESLDTIEQPQDSNPEEYRPEEEKVACYIAENFIEADVACSMLRGQGIPCAIDQSGRLDQTAATRERKISTPFSILVPKSRESEARQVIEETMSK